MKSRKWNVVLFSVLLIAASAGAGEQKAVGPTLQELSVTIRAAGSGGSGTIIVRPVEGKQVAWILTAAHVVKGLRSVQDVIAPDGTPKKQVTYRDAEILQEFRQDGATVGGVHWLAKIVNIDARRDLALLRVRVNGKYSESIVFYLDEQIPPPGTRIFHCLLPGTLVQGHFNTAWRSFYVGQAVEIVTESGMVLRVTQNHPVLTEHGMVAAGSLKQGQNLFRYVSHGKVSGNRTSVGLNCGSRSSEIDQKPARIEEVFRSLSGIGSTKTRRAEAGDFHGDGHFLKGNVDCVRANSYLAANGKTMINDHAGNVLFVMTPQRKMCCMDLVVPLHWRQCIPMQFSRLGQSSDGNIGICQTLNDYSRVNAKTARNGFSRFSALICEDQRFLVRDRSSIIPAFHTGCSQPVANCRTVARKLFGDLVSSQSGLVELDRVAQLRVIEYSGHVYDLHSRVGLMVADSIVVSNCASPAGEAASLTSGIVAQTGRRIEQFGGAEAIYDQVTCSALGGSSGGMITLEADGRLIGVLTLGLTGTDTFHYCVPVRRIRQWADEVGIAWLLDPKAKQPSEGEIAKIPLELAPPGFSSRSTGEGGTSVLRTLESHEPRPAIRMPQH